MTKVNTVEKVQVDKGIDVPKAEHKILYANFKQSEFAYARMSATISVDCKFEECLKPEFWSNVAHILRKNPATNTPDRSGAIIEVRTEDHSFYAELYVRSVHDQGLTVAVIKDPVYFGPAEVKSNVFKIRWNGSKKGFDILRVSDNALVGDANNIKTKEDAQSWINGMKG